MSDWLGSSQPAFREHYEPRFAARSTPASCVLTSRGPRPPAADTVTVASPPAWQMPGGRPPQPRAQGRGGPLARSLCPAQRRLPMPQAGVHTWPRRRLRASRPSHPDDCAARPAKQSPMVGQAWDCLLPELGEKGPVPRARRHCLAGAGAALVKFRDRYHVGRRLQREVLVPTAEVERCAAALAEAVDGAQRQWSVRASDVDDRGGHYCR